MQGEIIEEGETSICIISPKKNASESPRPYPLLTVLNCDLNALEWTTKLQSEGILPEMFVATLLGEGRLDDFKGFIEKLSEKQLLIDSPASRWIVGTGHSAVTAMNSVLDHPDIFGRGACLSTSFEGIESFPPLHSLVLRSLEERSILPEAVRLFFDYGTLGLDECYEPYHRDLGAIFRAKGWRDGREFQIIRSQKGSHTPDSWNLRLGSALRWLAPL
jgi:hypothetical protein